MKILKQEDNKIVIRLQNGARVEIIEDKKDYCDYVSVMSDNLKSKVAMSKINFDSSGNIENNVIFANFRGNFAKNKESIYSKYTHRTITTTSLRPNILDKYGCKEKSICRVHHKQIKKGVKSC